MKVMRVIRRYAPIVLIIGISGGCITPVYISQDFVGIGLYQTEPAVTAGDPIVTSVSGYGIGIDRYRIAVGYQALTLVYQKHGSEGIAVFTREMALKTDRYAEMDHTLKGEAE